MSNRTPQQQGRSEKREFLRSRRDHFTAKGIHAEAVADEFRDLLTLSEKVDGR